MSLREAWDEQAENWIKWARGVDARFFDFNFDGFLQLVPAPGRLTVDIGAGEGRVGRRLRALGHHVVELEQSPRLATASAELTPGAGVIADATRLPVRSGVADLATAFMSFQDVDDLEGSVAEAARVLAPGGAFVMAIVHPINSAGAWCDEDQTFTMYEHSYFVDRHYADDVEREGVRMRFESRHRPIEAYSRALEAAGLTMEAIREVGAPEPEDKWSRVPLFLDIRARK